MSKDNSSKDVHVFSKIDVKEIARKFSANRESLDQDDAFYICDIGDVIEKYIRWKKALPNAECFYAIKCNSDPLVLKTMAAIGMSFDCSSKVEISMALATGISADKIIYTHPYKQKSHFEYAKANGVNFLVFDSVDELHNIKEIYGSGHTKLLLRIIVNNDDAIYPQYDKFGADECMFSILLNTAKELKLNVIGVSFHCGCGNKNESIYSTVISLTKKVFISGKEYGFGMNHIDFGGGFVAKTGRAVTLENASRVLQESIHKEFSGGEFAEIKLMGEPGQYCVSSAFSLVTTVIGKKGVPVKDAEFDVKEFSDDKVEMFYYTNEGIFGSFATVWYGSHVIVSPLLLEENKGNKTSCTIWGHTMDGVDKICTEKEFPELFLGDKLLWLDMGAYTICMTTNFGGFKTTDIIYIMSDQMRKFLCENCSDEDLKAFNFI